MSINNSNEIISDTVDILFVGNINDGQHYFIEKLSSFKQKISQSIENFYYISGIYTSESGTFKINFYFCTQLLLSSFIEYYRESKCHYLSAVIYLCDFDNKVDSYTEWYYPIHQLDTRLIKKQKCYQITVGMHINYGDDYEPNSINSYFNLHGVIYTEYIGDSLINDVINEAVCIKPNYVYTAYDDGHDYNNYKTSNINTSMKEPLLKNDEEESHCCIIF